MVFFLILTLFSVFKFFSSATSSSSCALDGFGGNDFQWTLNSRPGILPEIIFYETKLNKNCSLRSYKLHPNLHDSGKHKNKTFILALGDSLDRYSSYHIISFLNENVHRPPFQYSLFANNVLQLNRPNGFANATLQANHIKNQVLEHVKQINSSSVPTHISFGSFIHDLKTAYDDYCRNFTQPIIDRTHLSCLCNTTMRRFDCDFSSTEIFEGVALPWCSDAVHAAWGEVYLLAIEGIHTLFPNALIFLRTQPPCGLIMAGNMYCQTYMNDQIRHWVQKRKYSYLRLLDYQELLKTQLHNSNDKLHYNGIGHNEAWNNVLLNTILDSYH